MKYIFLCLLFVLCAASEAPEESGRHLLMTKARRECQQANDCIICCDPVPKHAAAPEWVPFRFPDLCATYRPRFQITEFVRQHGGPNATCLSTGDSREPMTCTWKGTNWPIRMKPLNVSSNGYNSLGRISRLADDREETLNFHSVDPHAWFAIVIVIAWCCFDVATDPEMKFKTNKKVCEALSIMLVIVTSLWIATIK